MLAGAVRATSSPAFCRSWGTHSNVLAGTDVDFSSLPNLARVCAGAGMSYPSADETSQAGSIREQSRADFSQRRPIILLDVMGTLVRDPFYEDMPKFFGLTFKELLQQKHPSAWIEFESGQLTEPELVAKFFADGRHFDYEGLKRSMADGYAFLEGVEELLQKLKGRGYAMHAFTNYPCWYNMIEEKLQLSRYLDWTFVSCHMGRRKPDVQTFVDAVEHLAVDPQDCIFVDDRLVNVKSAEGLGMGALLFSSARQLEADLTRLGVDF
eukprot:jgi/Mesen1/6777/ME000348S06052